jgi:hypothetical protein
LGMDANLTPTNTPANEPKRHHVVPEFYLRRFAVDGNVTLVDRNEPTKRFTSSVENALVHKHFYSIDTEDGRDPGVETMLAEKIEGPAARAPTRVVDQGKDWALPGLRGPISMFLAFQFVRGPGSRHAAVEFFKAQTQQLALLMTPEMVRDQLAKEGERPTDEEIDDLIAFARDTSQYKIGVTSESNLHLDHALKTALELVPLIENRNWRLLEFEKPLLLTGDEPVALVGKSLEPGEPLGLLRAREVVFATDPLHALVMVRPDLECDETRSKGTPYMARLINRHVAFGCHRFIVQQPGTEPLMGISLPRKAAPARIEGDLVILQDRTSEKAARRSRLRRRRWRR